MTNPVFGGGSAEAYTTDQSLRFEDGYLSRTFPSAGNQKTWTYSAWIKKSEIDHGFYLFATDYSDTVNYMHLNLRGSHGTESKNYTGQVAWEIGGTDKYLRTTQKFRDCGAWMHICIVLNTPAASADERLRWYVNGEEVTDFDTNDRSGITQSSDLPINRAGVHEICAWNGSKIGRASCRERV